VALAVLAAIMSIVCHQAVATWLAPYGLPAMTLPFCFASLPFILIQGTTKRVIAVPLASMTTPEDHWQRVAALQAGFQLFANVAGPSPSGSKASSSPLAAMLAAAKKTVDAEAARVLFDAIDTDGSGELDQDEITAALLGSGLVGERSVSFIGKVLALIDTDGSGAVDFAEFKVFVATGAALSKLKVKMTHFFMFADVDHSGAPLLCDSISVGTKKFWRFMHALFFSCPLVSLPFDPGVCV